MAQLGQSSAPFRTLNFEQAVQKPKDKLMFTLVVGYHKVSSIQRWRVVGVEGVGVGW